MAETRLQDIYLCLKNKGFDVYFTGQHVGDCLKNYVVVKSDVSTPYLDFSTNVDYYSILLYVPQKYPTQVDIFRKQVENALLELYPMIKSANSITTTILDETVNGYMTSMTYVNYRKVNSPMFQKADLKEKEE
jgi:hypothetical protein